jgi:hypothetical protein
MKKVQMERERLELERAEREKAENSKKEVLGNADLRAERGRAENEILQKSRVEEKVDVEERRSTNSTSSWWV